MVAGKLPRNEYLMQAFQAFVENESMDTRFNLRWAQLICRWIRAIFICWNVRSAYVLRGELALLNQATQRMEDAVHLFVLPGREVNPEHKMDLIKIMRFEWD